MITTTNKPDAILGFGKYRGQRVSAVARSDGSYICWMSALPKHRGNPTMRAALAAHLPVAIERAAQQDVEYWARHERERQERIARLRARREALQAAEWARIAAEIA